MTGSILAAGAAGFLIGAALIPGLAPLARDIAGAEVKPLFSIKLPNVPGQSLSGAIVTFAPGVTAKPHHHAGSVLAYVLSGEIRSENSATGPAKTYKPGDWFFEPPGSEHTVSGNVSSSEPASLLAISIAEDGARLTTVDK